MKRRFSTKRELLEFQVDLTNALTAPDYRLTKRNASFMVEAAVLVNNGEVNIEDPVCEKKILQAMEDQYPRKNKKWDSEDFVRYVRDLLKLGWLARDPDSGMLRIPPSLLISDGITKFQRTIIMELDEVA